MDAMKIRMKCLEQARNVTNPADKLRTAFAFECYVYGGADFGMDMLKLDPAALGAPATPAPQPITAGADADDDAHDGFSAGLLH